MPEGLPEAAVLAGAGVAVVFLSLSILMLAIMLLSRLGPDAKEKAAPDESQVAGPSKESIAAMAVAVALAMEEQQIVPIIEHGEAPVPEPLGNAWTTAGRQRLMRSSANTGHKWRRG